MRDMAFMTSHAICQFVRKHRWTGVVWTEAHWVVCREAGGLVGGKVSHEDPAP